MEAGSKVCLFVLHTHTNAHTRTHIIWSSIQSFASWLFIFISLRFSIHHTAARNSKNSLTGRTHCHSNREQHWCLATVEIWPRPVFESEPTGSPLPRNNKPEICWPNGQTIGDQSEPGKKKMLIWRRANLQLALSNLRVADVASCGLNVTFQLMLWPDSPQQIHASLKSYWTGFCVFIFMTCTIT